MGFWTLFEVASMPVLQVLILSTLGAFMATSYWNLLPEDARKSINKVVFVVFTPALMFSSLAKTVTLQDIISWWFMPVNIGLTFLIGGLFGWIVVKILKPKPHLEGVVIATCASGNLGNLLLIVVPTVCQERGSPFGDHDACASIGISYASFSMALGGVFIWTYSYHLVRTSSMNYKALIASENASKEPNSDFDANNETSLLKGEDQDSISVIVPAVKSIEENSENQTPIILSEPAGEQDQGKKPFWYKLLGILHQIVEELLAPPTIAAILGFIFGATTWLRNLIIGEAAPLRVIQESLQILGDGTIPCISLILGGNLTQGLRSAKVKPSIIIGVIFVRYMILPVIGIGIVKAANTLGFLPSDPLFHYLLLVQFTLPPAMSIGTMVQLFNVGQEECSVLFMWTYLVAALALTSWSTVYMWLLS